MKKLPVLAVIALLLVAVAREQGVPIPGFPLGKESADSTLLEAYNKRQSDVQVQGKGVVTKILRDDLQGSRHQRFILELAGGQTVLIAHNIDLAPRLPGIGVGDRVAAGGEALLELAEARRARVDPADLAAERLVLLIDLRVVEHVPALAVDAEHVLHELQGLLLLIELLVGVDDRPSGGGRQQQAVAEPQGGAEFEDDDIPF